MNEVKLTSNNQSVFTPDYWQPLFEIDVPHIVLDADFKIIWMNKAAYEFLNVEYNVFKPPLCAFFSPEVAPDDCMIRDMLIFTDDEFQNAKFSDIVNAEQQSSFGISTLKQGDKSGWLLTAHSNKNSTVDIHSLLYRTHSMFESIFNAFPYALIIVDKAGTITNLNYQGESLLGVKKVLSIGSHFSSFVALASETNLKKSIKHVRASGNIELFEDSFVVKNDDTYFEIPVQITVFPIKYENSQKGEVCISIADISWEITMQKEQSLLSKAIENSREGIAILDKNFNVLYCNQAILDMTFVDINDILGHHLSEIFFRDERFDRFWHVLSRHVKETGTFSSELMWESEGKEGAYDIFLSVLDDNVPEESRYVFSLRDISDEKKYEERLFQSKKMESIGNLARTFVHDFRNILTTISTSSELIRMKYINDAPKMSKWLDSIDNACITASDILKDLSSYTRESVITKSPLPIKSIIDMTLSIMKPSLDNRILFNINYEDDLPVVNVDRTKILEVFHNLFINACEAMPDGGNIIVKVSQISIDDISLSKFPEATCGEYIHVEVADSGCGIEVENLEKIFDPFFSSGKDHLEKNVSGLGLYIVYSIVRAHDGFITVKSKIGEGTTFNVYVPVNG